MPAAARSCFVARHLGWTTISGVGIEIQTDNAVPQSDAHVDEHYVELDSHNNSPMQRTVNLLIGIFRLSFFLSPRTDNLGANEINFSVAQIFGNMVKVLNDTCTGPSEQLNTEVGNWTEIVATFEVKTAGAYALSFVAGGTSHSNGGFIDGVSLTPEPVPLPAGWLLLVTALGDLAALRRRPKLARTERSDTGRAGVSRPFLHWRMDPRRCGRRRADMRGERSNGAAGERKFELSLRGTGGMGAPSRTTRR